MNHLMLLAKRTSLLGVLFSVIIAGAECRCHMQILPCMFHVLRVRVGQWLNTISYQKHAIRKCPL